MANKNEQHDAEHKDEGKPHPGAGPAAQTPQQDHTPRQEEAAARERQEAGASQQAAPDTKGAAVPPSAVDPAAQAAGSIGGQIILDFNGDGSLGARGGSSNLMNENVQARDAHLVALGLDPVSPSGPPPSLEQRKAQAAAAEAYAKAVDTQHATPGSGAASRVSSLAAGLITEPADVPIAPPPGAQAAHK
jgi:hypothetical protein